MFIPRKEVIKSGTVWDLDVINQITYQGVPFIPGGNATDELVKITAADTTAGYLGAKVAAGTGIQLTTTNPGANETLTIACTVVDLDVKVKVSANDTTAGFLNGKLVAGTGITFTENNDGGDETLTVTLGSHTHAASDITSGVLGTARLASTGTASASTYLRGDQAWSGLDAGHITAGTVPTARLATGTANSTTYLRGDQTWQTITGGVAGFTGSQNATSPNNTVNASRLLVDAVSTNADAVIQPKGTGSLLAQLPDGTATGGNKRGDVSVDLQMSRTVNTQVASGSYSIILGGNRNTANANWGIVVGGSVNTASGVTSFIGGGQNNTASGNNSIVNGGSSNAASNAHATVAGGQNNTANQSHATVSGGYLNYAQGIMSNVAGGQNNNVTSTYSGILTGISNNIQSGSHNAILGGDTNTIYSTSNYSAILGGQQNQVSSAASAFAYGTQNWANHNFTVASGNQTQTTKPYQRVWSSGGGFSNGDNQQSEEHFTGQTTDATLKTLTAANQALNSNTSLAVPLGGVILYRILVSCKRFSSSDFGAWEITGCATNFGGTITLYNNTVSLIHRTNASYTVATAADSTNDTVNINVTGVAGHTILWSAYAITIRSVIA